MDHRLALQPALVALAIAFATPLWSAGPALAQDKMTPQQQRMKDCNADAGKRKLSGDTRKQFMSACLAGETSSGAAATSQQEKMKTCNAQANKQQLKGDARQTYMSGCLKN
jgi:psiF repeat